MRKRLRNRDEVCHFWAHQLQSEGRAGNVFFEGPTIYSYGRHFPVATILRGVYVFTSRKYSPTTSQHWWMIRRAVPRGAEIIVVRDPTDSAHLQRERTEKQVSELLAKAKRARTRKQEYAVEAIKVARDFNRLAELQERSDRIDTDRFADWEKYIEEENARRDAEEEAAQRERESINRERIEAWLAGAPGYCPHTFKPLLRLVDRTGQLTGYGAGEIVIETSWGAEVPAEDARRLWPLIERARQPDSLLKYMTPGVVKVGNYSLDKIDANGNLHIGCHLIEYSEIERMARQLGLLKEEEIAA